ncbi:MAG TPA: DNA primase [Planctomycetes bacterium]|jgi:DNA primase|nr:DNA primase [Planctomycetota bacterium]
MADLTPFVDKLKSHLSIDVVVGEKVRLDRKGNRMWGLCPFHAENTPSFTVSVDRGSYKCFGCGQFGDIISFIRETEGLEFFEALRVLADQAGLDMPQQFSKQDSKKSALKTQAREALQIARRYYAELLAGPEGAGARKYLEDRQVPAESWGHFGLGWAPRNRQDLLGLLRKNDIDIEAAELAGLAIRVEGSGEIKARFWERLMFPISDSGGRTLGFSGRYLPGSFAAEKKMGKYINSPEGPLFPKRRILFGVDKLQVGLRNNPEAPIVICEGNLDVMQLHNIGQITSLAALGTAFTDDHSRILSRYDRPVVLLFDPDTAGAKAAFSAGRILVAEGIDVRVARLPDGCDPADMVANGDKSLLNQAISDSWDILKWRLDTWSSKSDLSQAAVKDKAAREMAEWITTTPSPVIAETWQREAASFLGISQDTLRRLYDPHTEVQPPMPTAHPNSSQPQNRKEVLQRNEREIIGTLLVDPSVYSFLRQQLDVLKLSDPSTSSLLQWIRLQREQGITYSLTSALAQFDNDDQYKWLDSFRHQIITDPRLVLERALSALPANTESHNVSQDEPMTLEDLAQLSRKISLKPNATPDQP